MNVLYGHAIRFRGQQERQSLAVISKELWHKPRGKLFALQSNRKRYRG